MCYPRIPYSPEGLPLDNRDPFPSMKNLFTHMTKWFQGQDKALPLTTKILNILKTNVDKAASNSLQACIFDAMFIGLQTGSRCSKYCRSNQMDSANIFCKAPLTYYASTYAGYPIAFVPSYKYSICLY